MDPNLREFFGGRRGFGDFEEEGTEGAVSALTHQKQVSEKRRDAKRAEESAKVMCIGVEKVLRGVLQDLRPSLQTLQILSAKNLRTLRASAFRFKPKSPLRPWRLCGSVSNP